MRRLTIAALAPGLLSLGACAAGQGAIIDWIDFVQWNGITYVAVPPTFIGSATPILGAQIATTKRMLSGHETDPSHKLQEGDAAFLQAGTPIHSVTGYRSTFRIGVAIPNGIRIYEADTNPKAQTGADLVDLDGKVDYISINDTNEHELAAIRDPAASGRLVGLILQARVDQSVHAPASGAQYFVAIHFRDGTQSVRAYWPSTGELSRGILTGPEFARAILGALPTPAA